MDKFVSCIQKNIDENKSISNEIKAININRVYYLSILLIPLIIIDIIIIATEYNDALYVDVYLQILFGINVYILLVLPVFAYYSNKYRKLDKYRKNVGIIINMFIINILITGVVITLLDQMFTKSIMLFFMTSVLVAAVFNIRPSVSFFYYGTLLFLIITTLSIFQPDKNILTGQIIQSLTAIVISFSTSFITWKTSKITILQNRKIVKQQKELECKNAKLSNIAFYDHMTELFNRRKIDEIIQEELKQIKHNGYKSSIIILDIDDFKNINDKYGHPVGDKILIKLAKLLEKSTRATDAVGRWGGEEFIILLPFTREDTAEKIAEKLRNKIQKYRFELNNMSVYITASFGVTEIGPEDDEFRQESYKKVDKALYIAKRENKNKVVVFQ